MIDIRLLRPSDAPHVVELRLLGLQESPTAFGSSYEEEVVRPVEFTANRLDVDPADGRFTLGAFDGERLVGMGGFGRQSHIKMQHMGFIWGVYVHPDHRKKGIGRQLINAIIARVHDYDDVIAIKLSVNAENVAAFRLYETLGFRQYGHEPRAMKIGGQYYDEFHMIMDLD